MPHRQARHFRTAGNRTAPCYRAIRIGSEDRARSMGMFFLFGMRTKSTPIKQIQYSCPKCTHTTVFTAMESKRWFTLFFIPVIPLGGRFLIRCNLCGLTLKCSPELKEQITAKVMAAGA